MPLKTLELFFWRLNEFLAAHPKEQMELVWHGGEPLLLGPDYFRQALRFQQGHCPETADRIRHSIQSNLTLFSRELAEVLRQLGVDSIGTSYEPIPNIRGLGLKRDWADYNRRFMKGLRLVEEEGFNWGVIYVVTKPALKNPLKIFHFLSNLSPKGSFMFNPVIIYGHRTEHLRITAREYTDFLGTIFPVWWRNREEYPQIEPFFSLTQNLLEKSRSLMCSDSGRCAHSHLNLLPDGSLSHCGRSADWDLLNYGTIFEKTFDQALKDPQRKILLKRNVLLPRRECKGCRFWDICHGGCPLDAWSATGSFLHKTEWCDLKKDFIEIYFEPTVHPGPAEKKDSPPAQQKGLGHHRPAAFLHTRSDNQQKSQKSEDGLWINPIGGLGDTLMISGVLKQVLENYPSRRFNLVERTKYRAILEGHPAIEKIGSPAPGAEFLSTNYWDCEAYRLPGGRAYQALASLFGLEQPVEERLYVPWAYEDDPLLMRSIPWKGRNILLSQSSDSPRKQMGIRRWEALVERLADKETGIFQVGRMPEDYIRGAYSLLGLTNPRQLISLVRHFDAVVTSDNFIMHAAHLHGVPAVVLWGPTDHRIYGYADQVHLSAKRKCEFSDGCIGPGRGDIYQTVCPRGPEHCLETIPLKAISTALRKILY
jgi:radical SAM protein with 4Fe4S-binding SPASM domain